MLVPSSHILVLPDDLLLLIMTFSRVDDILSLRHTCKRLSNLTKLRWLWTDTLKRHVINKGLPVPAAAKDIRTLSAHDLEVRAVHAARFHANWTSGHPQVKQSFTFSVHPYFTGDLPRIVTHVKFLPSRNGELIVTVVNNNTVICWDVPLGLKADHFHVAQWRNPAQDFLDPLSIADIVINQDPSSRALFAVLIKSDVHDDRCEILVFSLDKFHGKLNVLNSCRGDDLGSLYPLHSLKGDLVLCGDLMTYNWREADKLSKFRCPNTSAENSLLTAKSVYGCMIAVRTTSIHAFPDPFSNSSREPQLAGTSTELPYEAEEAVIVARGLCNDVNNAKLREPITILLRCSDEGFNTIRQYDFMPKHYDPDARTGESLHGSENTGRPDMSLGLSFSCPSLCTRVIPVAPSCSRLQFSASGKGLWLETRNIPVGLTNSLRPARCLIGVDVSREPNAIGATSKPDQEVARRQEWGNFLNICEKEVYARGCGMREITTKRYQVKSIDLQDCVGRIVIGDRSGNVEVLEYA